MFQMWHCICKSPSKDTVFTEMVLMLFMLFLRSIASGSLVPRPQRMTQSNSCDAKLAQSRNTVA